MIYVASLSLIAKKAMGQKCYQTSLGRIVDTLPIDPQVSNMDVVLFGPQDLSGQFGKKIVDATASRHKDVCVIYICTNDREQALFPNAPHVKQIKKIKGNEIERIITEFYEDDVAVAERKYSSRDDRVMELGENPSPPQPESVETPMPEPVMEQLPAVEDWLETILTPAEPRVQQPAVPKMEDMINSVKSVADWDILKEQLNRDGIIRQLILENNEFAGVVNMLEVWDLRIKEVWADTHKSNEEKMRAVQEFGANRQMLQATQNSILVDKFVSLVERIVAVCTATVDERVDAITHSVISLQINKDAFLDYVISGDYALETKLYDKTVELQYILGELCKMFAFLHHQGMDEILTKLDEKLPSTNEFINNVLSVGAKLFKPTNTVDLGTTIINTLQNGQVKLSMVEDKIKSLMESIFNVVLTQQDIIEYQRNVIDCLRANHVESLVVRDSLLKNCFHVITGTENTGLSATVAIYAGMRSRQHNTLVVDLTGHSHYDRYGYTTTRLDDFMLERVQSPLLFVTGEPTGDPESLFQLMEELKARLTYFHNLIVVLDARQNAELDQLGREALSISYVTNCTVASIEAIKQIHKTGRNLPNVCHKLVCIDNPIDSGSLLTSLEMDVSMTQLIPLPYLREIRKAAVIKQPPHTYSDVLRVFEEAFRV